MTHGSFFISLRRRTSAAITSRILVIAGLSASLGLAALAHAAPRGAAARIQAPAPVTADDAFLAMREAVRMGDLDGAAALGQRVLTLEPNYPLAAYIDYWPMAQRLHSLTDPPPDDSVRAFLAQNEGTLIADMARRDWLMALAKRGDFATFDVELPKMQSSDDPQLACYAFASKYLRAQRHMDDTAEGSVNTAVVALAAPANINGDGCALLLSLLSGDNQISEGDIWGWIRLASDANLPVAMKRYALVLPTADAQAVLAFDAINSNPAQWLARHGSENIAGIKQLWQIALTRMARNSPADAAALFESQYAARISGAAKSAIYAELAAAGYKRQLPDASDWARRGVDAHGMPEDVYASLLRIALRDQDFAFYRSVYDHLPAEMKRTSANDGAWTYWLARADKAGGQTQAGNELLTSIAGQFNFYGQLATEDLGQPIVLPPYAVAPTDAEIAQAAAHPAFARAQRFYVLNLRSLGNMEWNFPLKNMTDRQLLASAEYARRMQIYDRAVNTADRTKAEHDFRLRFLAPYFENMRGKAAELNLDIDWVYGLIRQESRFVQVAHSSAGASGLMQLMPGTARYVAKKIGLSDYSPDQVSDLDTNLTLGTNYLRMVMDQLDNVEVLATAAYNAGPGRARNWRQSVPHGQEGALFAETIPFPETRDYVKKVMSNAVYYGLVFTPGQKQSLKQRMGTIGPDFGAPPLPADLP